MMRQHWNFDTVLLAVGNSVCGDDTTRITVKIYEQSTEYGSNKQQ